MILPVLDPEAIAIFDYPQVTGTPERRLLLAILERAILDYVGNDPEEIAEAEGWLFDSEAELSDKFSFPWVCHYLDLNEQHISKQIKAMPKRGKRRVAPWYFAAKKVN